MKEFFICLIVLLTVEHFFVLLFKHLDHKTACPYKDECQRWTKICKDLEPK